MALTKCKECGEQISTKAAACPKCGAVPKKKTSLVTWLIVIIFAIGFFGAITGKNSSTGTGSTSPAPESPDEVAKKATTLDYTWGKIGFDNVMEGNFKITNNSQYTIKDITIECMHFAKSGTRIDSNKRTIYDVVAAHSTKSFNKFNMGFIHSQANSTSCEITDLKV